MPRELDDFLAGGDPPLVFTLGSSAVGAAGRFYAESVAAAERLGVRAVLLTGGFAENEQAAPSPRRLHVATAPHQSLFPRAAAVVHHGGVGTTGQALRAGRPTLVVPHAHDQADNAARVVRLGVAQSIPASAYQADGVVKALDRLLRDASFAVRAREVGELVRAEGGGESAADAIEAALSGVERQAQRVPVRS
jgi:UDP:flavonoid glycosyltransferase YjiC (YdhE family)